MEQGTDQGVGAQIKRLREEREWSMAKLAVEADMSVSGVSMIENGKRNLTTTTLAKLARAFGVEVRDLFPLGQAPLPEFEDERRASGIEVVGEAFFVPLEEGEEEDTVTLRVYYVRLFEGGEPILKAMREASPEEAAEMRRQREKAGRSRQ